MTPEQEFADFVGKEARKRGLSYFLWAGNNDTLKFIYKTEIMSDKDGKIPDKLQVSVDIIQWLRDAFKAGGCEPY